MAIRKIARLGHPVLRQVGRKLTEEEIRSPEAARLIQDMTETMHEYGGVGLAAPQVHESLQLAVIEFAADNDRYPDMGSQALTVVINPVIRVLDPTEDSYWEGCLSVPDLRGLVGRPRKIQVDYLDEKAQAMRMVAEGFLATVLQHELDHLQGVLFIDRIKNEPGKTQLAFLDEFRKYSREER